MKRNGIIGRKCLHTFQVWGGHVLPGPGGSTTLEPCQGSLLPRAGNVEQNRSFYLYFGFILPLETMIMSKLHVYKRYRLARVITSTPVCLRSTGLLTDGAVAGG